jgi:hypothetical protein
MIASGDGLGHLLIYAASSLRILDIFAPLPAISILGLALNAAFPWGEQGAAGGLSRARLTRRPWAWRGDALRNPKPPACML